MKAKIKKTGEVVEILGYGHFTEFKDENGDIIHSSFNFDEDFVIEGKVEDEHLAQKVWLAAHVFDTLAEHIGVDVFSHIVDKTANITNDLIKKLTLSLNKESDN